MSPTANEFALLAERAERGEVGAAAELRRRLEEALGPMVRRALRGRGTSLLDQSIRDTARRTSTGDSRPADLTARVGTSLSEQIVGRLRAGADSVTAGHETVVV